MSPLSVLFVLSPGYAAWTSSQYPTASIPTRQVRAAFPKGDAPERDLTGHHVYLHTLNIYHGGIKCESKRAFHFFDYVVKSGKHRF